MSTNFRQRTWDSCLIVQLKKILEKAGVKYPIIINEDETKYVTGASDNLPDNLSITITIDNTSNDICVYEHKGQLHIGTRYNRRHNKGRRSKYVNIIAKSVLADIPVVEANVRQAIATENQDKTDLVNLRTSLGIDKIDKKHYCYEYNSGRNYHIDFNVIHNKDESDYYDESFPEANIRISSIGGVFTPEEFKQIIKIVGLNPRAVNEKLTTPKKVGY